VSGSVPIDGAVVGYALSLDLLSKVFALSQLEQFAQLLLVGDKLRIRAVHQLDTAHLVKRYGRKLHEPFLYDWVEIHASSDYFGGKDMKKLRVEGEKHELFMLLAYFFP